MCVPLFSEGSIFRWAASTARNAAEMAGSGSATAGAADRLREDVQRMRGDIERLLMITEALWGMVKEQHGYADEELFRRITEIDLSDGRADGRVAPSPAEMCSACGRKVAKHRPLCLYCGHPLVADPFAR